MDVFTMLESDHRHVERLLERLADSEAGPERKELVANLAKSISAHMAFEEKAIYPLLVGLDAEMAEEGEIEHGLARNGLDQMSKLSDAPGFAAALDMVTAGIAHHVEDEEQEAFPLLRESCDEATRERLGAQLEQSKRDLGVLAVELDDATKEELLDRARDAGIEGRSNMSKDELKAALAG
jgi:hemerythrin superfamily protein